MLSRQKIKSQNLEKNKAPQATLTSITKDKDYQTIDDLINIYMTFDSKMLSEPIINPSNFHAALEKELPNLQAEQEKLEEEIKKIIVQKDSLSNNHTTEINNIKINAISNFKRFSFSM